MAWRRVCEDAGYTAQLQAPEGRGFCVLSEQGTASPAFDVLQPSRG